MATPKTRHSITQAPGGGAYDTNACYQSVIKRGLVAAFPLRRRTRYAPHGDDGSTQIMRNATVRRSQTWGREVWHVCSVATRQVVAENASFRFKALCGGALVARRFDKNQRAEGIMKRIALNRLMGVRDAEVGSR